MGALSIGLRLYNVYVVGSHGSGREGGVVGHKMRLFMYKYCVMFKRVQLSDYGDEDATKGDTNAKMIEGRPPSELI